MGDCYVVSFTLTSRPLQSNYEHTPEVCCMCTHAKRSHTLIYVSVVLVSVQRFMETLFKATQHALKHVKHSESA